ncbi:Cullin-2, partial [Coelomomyces lativittatus]
CELAYRLLSIITDGVNLLTSVYEQFVVDKGKNYLSQDPNLLVDELGSFQQARSDEIANWFRMDPSFVASLDKAFRSLVNTSNTKFPELLSKYCDFLLKRSAESSEQWIDQQLNTVILLFNYIDDKDVFQKYYSRLLAKRLILKTSFNHEIEQLMLSKLKLACGVEYTSKLQRMLTDVHLSHELTLEFNEARFINEFAPLVLTAGAWPVSHINTIQFHSLPSELEVTISAFNDFYNRKYNGRKLTWLWHLCRVDVKLHGFDKRYEISMALYHFIILSMLNHVTTISMGEVSKLLPMPSSEFEKLVQSFTEIQLLTLNAKEIELNLKFTSKRTKIKLNMASAYETTTEYNEKSLNEDRRLFLEATIVRIMKSRRELSHQELVTLVLEQSQTRFHPTPGIIKKCIEQLIEKQYLERAGDDHQNYIYMA